PALGAHVHVGGELFVVDGLPALWTLDPQPFGHPARLLLHGGRDWLARLLEPRHRAQLNRPGERGRAGRRSSSPPALPACAYNDFRNAMIWPCCVDDSAR